jgi:hypothetical protein
MWHDAMLADAVVLACGSACMDGVWSIADGTGSTHSPVKNPSFKSKAADRPVRLQAIPVASSLRMVVVRVLVMCQPWRSQGSLDLRRRAVRCAAEEYVLGRVRAETLDRGEEISEVVG